MRLMTLKEIVEAQERGDAIEVKNPEDVFWSDWKGLVWYGTSKYRIQSKPKKTVKYCLWGNLRNSGAGNIWFGKADATNRSDQWIRIPGTEVDVEVAE